MNCLPLSLSIFPWLAPPYWHMRAFNVIENQHAPVRRGGREGRMRLEWVRPVGLCPLFKDSSERRGPVSLQLLFSSFTPFTLPVFNLILQVVGLSISFSSVIFCKVLSGTSHQSFIPNLRTLWTTLKIRNHLRAASCRLETAARRCHGGDAPCCGGRVHRVASVSWGVGEGRRKEGKC